jgi:hypothetical protein
MKPIKPLLVAAAAVVTFTIAASACDCHLSPKAKEQKESLRRVPQPSSPETIDRSAQFFGSPKSREVEYSLRKVPSTGPSIDLAHAPSPMLPAKDPRYYIVLRNNAVQEFEIAPVK